MTLNGVIAFILHYLIALQADYIWPKLIHTGDAAVAWSLLTAKLFVIL